MTASPLVCLIAVYSIYFNYNLLQMSPTLSMHLSFYHSESNPVGVGQFYLIELILSRLPLLLIFFGVSGINKLIDLEETLFFICRARVKYTDGFLVLITISVMRQFICTLELTYHPINAQYIQKYTFKNPQNLEPWLSSFLFLQNCCCYRTEKIEN